MIGGEFIVSYPLETTGSQLLSGGSLSLSTALVRKFRLVAVLIHFSGAVTQTVKVTVDSASGANYDTVIDTGSLSSATDYSYLPENDLDFVEGTNIKVTCTNATTPAITAYATIITKSIG